MRKTFYLYTICMVLTIVAGGSGCDNRDKRHGSKPHDTLYTQERAMAMYGYQPLQALRIIDSAVIVGNISEMRADLNRARIYSQSVSPQGLQLDSLLGGPKGVRFDTARAIGERLLGHDSAKASLRLRQDILEILVYSARQKQDTTQWLQRSQELVKVCRQQGAETEALRTEAELAASLYYAGQQEQSLARLDTVIGALSSLEPFRFNELDALIIASKRKIGVLQSMSQFTQILPIAHRIIELLDDYEQHPQNYHDGTYREPNDSTDRNSYIRFYRTQAQNFITATYAVLGQEGKMVETFQQLENTVREATAREHIARYRALEQRRETEQQESRTLRFQILASAGFLLALLTVIFAIYAIIQRRKEERKNRVLVQQISEAIDYKQKYEALEKSVKAAEAAKVSEDTFEGKGADELFDIIRHRIVEDKLFLDPLFDRQAAADHFGVSVRRISLAFGKGSTYKSISDFIRECRLEYACQLLRTTDMTISEIVTASGFSRTTTFNHDFKARYELSPTDFRNQLKES